jgi:hypothetical protein
MVFSLGALGVFSKARLGRAVFTTAFFVVFNLLVFAGS